MFIAQGKGKEILDTGFLILARSIQHRVAAPKIGAATGPRTRAFTLLEIMLAVTILAGMSLAIYRFVQSNIVTLRISSESAAVDARYGALRELLTAQWQSLPSGAAALTGEPIKVNDLSRDQVSWTCGPGPGLLTRYAPGDYVVSMRLRAENNKSDRIDLGFLRKPQADRSFTNVKESWIPLLENVRSLQIRYFDSRLNTWQDKWTDNVTLPRLVKVTVERTDASVPWEAIIALGRTPL
jgi:prepilin-type N-terminal cleavage/methylation domain-containing protein